MKNIVILSHVSNDGSRYCSYVHSHAKALINEGNNVTVLAVNNYFPFLKKKIKKGIEIIDGVKVIFLNKISISNFLCNSKINANGYFYYYSIRKIFKKLYKNKIIDIVDAHTYKVEGYAAYLLKKKYKMKTIVTLHGTSFTRSFNNKNGRKEIVKIGKIIDYYVCVSDKIKNNLLSLGIKNIQTIYNGIYMKDIDRNNCRYNIITVGSFVKCKNIDLVIKAFSKVKNNYSEAQLTVIGDGPLKDEYHNLAEKLNVNVNFTGFLSNEEVVNYLAESNVFVLPSSPEGFGICYVEAMYAGCITIGTKNEGIDEFIKDGKNGFLIDPIEEQIIQKIVYIFDNDCSNIRSIAIDDAKSMTWECNAKKYLKL